MRLLTDEIEDGFTGSVQLDNLIHDSSEIRCAERQDTVDEIPEIVRELVILLLELLPGEIRILLLGDAVGQIVSDRVRIIVLRDIMEPDGMVATGRELLSLKIQEFIPRNIGRQIIVSGCHEDRRPDDRMKDNIVLPDEMDDTRTFSFPGILEQIHVSHLLGKLLQERNIPDRSLEPDIHLLLLFSWDRYPPSDISGDRPILQTFIQPLPRRSEHIRLPGGLRIDPFADLILEFA